MEPDWSRILAIAKSGDLREIERRYPKQYIKYHKPLGKIAKNAVINKKRREEFLMAINQFPIAVVDDTTTDDDTSK